MPFIEVFRLAFAALGANKLRSGLTMLGITIGVFSIISVMTATGALQSSIETGLSFLGSNFFQFAKYPVLGGGGPQAALKYGNRRNVTFEEAMLYKRLMTDTGAAISLKVFDNGKRVSYGRLRTNPNMTVVGHEREFPRFQQFHHRRGTQPHRCRCRSRAERYRDRSGRAKADSSPVEDPIGKLIKINEKNFTVIRGPRAQRAAASAATTTPTCWCPSPGFFENYGRANRTVNIATQSTSQPILPAHFQYCHRSHAHRP